MQRLPCIWCAALSAAGQRSAACLRLSVVESAAVHPFAVCVLHAGGSAINAQLAPSSGISAAVCCSSGAPHLQQQVSGQPPACIRLRSNSAAVCMLHGWRIKNSCFPHFQTKSVKPLDGSLQRRDIMPP